MLPATALLSGDSRLGASVWGGYAFVRGLGAWALVVAARCTGSLEPVLDRALALGRAARIAAAAQLLAVAVALATAVGL